MAILSTILDVIFPRYCLCCKKKGVELCLDCLAESPQAERETPEWIFPIFDYRHPPVKMAVRNLKYKGHRNLAAIFAEVIYGRIIEEISEQSIMRNFKNPLLIPIPISPIRKRERGFNQALLICKELTKLDEDEKNFELAEGILIKPRETPHQARIENRASRIKNLIGSFSVNNNEAISSRNIILIDDVTTTGATLSEARKVLRQAGARKIIAFTLAH